MMELNEVCGGKVCLCAGPRTEACAQPMRSRVGAHAHIWVMEFWARKMCWCCPLAGDESVEEMTSCPGPNLAVERTGLNIPTGLYQPSNSMTIELFVGARRC